MSLRIALLYAIYTPMRLGMRASVTGQDLASPANVMSTHVVDVVCARVAKYVARQTRVASAYKNVRGNVTQVGWQEGGPQGAATRGAKASVSGSGSACAAPRMQDPKRWCLRAFLRQQNASWSLIFAAERMTRLLRQARRRVRQPAQQSAAFRCILWVVQAECMRQEGGRIANVQKRRRSARRRDQALRAATPRIAADRRQFLHPEHNTHPTLTRHEGVVAGGVLTPRGGNEVGVGVERQ